MSRARKAHRSRSDSPERNEDLDYLATLRSSRQRDRGQSLQPSAAQSRDTNYDEEADRAYAFELQSRDASNTHSTTQLSGTTSLSESEFIQDALNRDALPWALDEQEAKIANYHPETATCTKFTTLAAFLTHIRAARCHACNVPFFRSEFDVRNMLQEWKSGKSALSCLLKCSKCLTSSCIACAPTTFTELSVIGVQGKQVSWCCTGGRLFLLWLLLCGLDDHFTVAKFREMTHSKSKQQSQFNNTKKKANQHERDGDGGVGFGGDSGYVSALPDFATASMLDEYMEVLYALGTIPKPSGSESIAGTTNASSKAKALSAQQTEDQFYGLHMQLIEGLLPSSERDSNFDLFPPNLLAQMLVESEVLNYCAELLRNDSLEDARTRIGLYQALISLIRTLGSHYVTASASIYNERSVRKDKSNLLLLSFRECPESSAEKASSLLDSLNNLKIQSEFVLQRVKNNEQEFQSHDAQHLLSLSRQISGLREYLIALSSTYGHGQITQSKAEIPTVNDVPDDDILASHAYGPIAKSLRSAPPGRFKRLITEITLLKTSLPSDIYVRHAESRPDVQKWIIIGAASTPYENGIFEFDVFCDENFPKQPPLVQFKTTGGGLVSFNPNLYADGKVCLSLLGTWHGM
jgi:hypothetical protein